MSRPKKSIEERNAMRERILAAASDLLETLGPDQISIRAITTRLGVSPMSFYSYFTSRDDLISALSEQQMHSLRDSAAQYLARAEQEGADLILREVLQLFADSALEQPRRYLLQWAIPADNPDQLPIRPWHLDIVLRFLSSLMEVGIRQGKFRAANPQTAALTLFSLINGPLLMRTSGRLADSDQFAVVLDEIENLAVQYLTPPTA